MSQENARLRERLDALALDLARREGEAQATAWTVAELETKLAQVSAAPLEPALTPDMDMTRQLKAALDELDVLRRALAQEHEARVKAESVPQDGAATAVDRAD